MTVFLNGKRYFAYLTVPFWRYRNMTVFFRRFWKWRYFLNGKRYCRIWRYFYGGSAKWRYFLNGWRVFDFWRYRLRRYTVLGKYDGIPPSTGTDVQHGKITSGIFPRTTLIFKKTYAYHTRESWSNEINRSVVPPTKYVATISERLFFSQRASVLKGLAWF